MSRNATTTTTMTTTATTTTLAAPTCIDPAALERIRRCDEPARDAETLGVLVRMTGELARAVEADRAVHREFEERTAEVFAAFNDRLRTLARGGVDAFESMTARQARIDAELHALVAALDERSRCTDDSRRLVAELNERLREMVMPRQADAPPPRLAEPGPLPSLRGATPPACELEPAPRRALEAPPAPRTESVGAPDLGTRRRNAYTKFVAFSLETRCALGALLERAASATPDARTRVEVPRASADELGGYIVALGIAPLPGGSAAVAYELPREGDDGFPRRRLAEAMREACGALATGATATVAYEAMARDERTQLEFLEPFLEQSMLHYDPNSKTAAAPYTFALPPLDNAPRAVALMRRIGIVEATPRSTPARYVVPRESPAFQTTALRVQIDTMRRRGTLQPAVLQTAPRASARARDSDDDNDSDSSDQDGDADLWA